MKPSKPQKHLPSERQIEAPKLESLKQINLNAAGLDIGDREIYACVPEDR
jgi:hypothetical protein